MYTQMIVRYVVGTFVIFVLLFISYTLPVAASLISDQQIKTQEREVQIATVEALQQDLKLLQMLFIQKLEARVKYLQTLTKNR